MHRSSIAFAIQAPEEIARERLRAMLRFYDPCGELELRLRREATLNLTVGELLIGGETIASADREGAIFGAGERLPANLSASLDLLDASDAQLRALDGAQAAVVARDGRARIVAGAGAPRTWFGAGDAFATSIAAAALLGAVTPLIDPDALPELLMLGACLGGRTHVKGVRSLPPSAVVEFGAGEHEAWPRLARWARIEPREAGAHAWKALLQTLARRLEGERSPWVLLDGDEDAVVLLAAAAELGIDLPSFSPGDEFGAASPLRTAAAGREHALRNALLSDGMSSLAPFAIAGSPRTASTVLSAFGGQIARGCVYPDELLKATPADHRPAIEIKLREWFDQASASAPNAWSALDMLLIEEGIGNDGPQAALPFATREPWRAPEVVRALSSLSPETRAASGWREHALTGMTPPEPPAPQTQDNGWERLPEIGEWLTAEPLSHSLLSTALGDLWVDRLKEQVSEAGPGEGDQALRAASAVIFDQRLQAAAQPPPGSASRLAS